MIFFGLESKLAKQKQKTRRQIESASKQKQAQAVINRSSVG